MEKFNTWADNFTGVQPFVPPGSPPTTTVRLLLRYFIGPIIALIRLPFVLTFGLILLITETIFSKVNIPVITTLLRKTINAIVGRLLLLSMGFWVIEEKWMPSKRGNKIPNYSPVSKVSSGHLLVCNHSSYVDLIYLLTKYSPEFTSAPNFWSDAPPSEILIPETFVSSVLKTIYQPKVSSDKNAIPIQKIISRSSGPVVVFPEATTTNGKVLLGCVQVIPSDTTFQKQIKNKIHIIGFKYDYDDFSPVYTVGSFIVHLWRLCCQINNNIQVVHVINEDIPNPKDVQEDPEWSDNIYTMLAGVIQKRRAKIDVMTKHPFLEYYYTHKKTYN